MRPSTVLAALVAAPFVAARGSCRHKPKPVPSVPAGSEYEEPTSTPTATVDPITNVPDDDVHIPDPVETYEPDVPVETSQPSTDTPDMGPDGESQALSSETHSAISTFYTGDMGGGHCSFTTYTLPASIYGVALNTAEWDNAGWCGACVIIKGPKGNSIKAMFVDSCPTCNAGHIDLFPDAFAALDDPNIGVIDVSYQFVECGISSPIVLHSKDSTSEYYFSMQVVNSNVPVESLEVSTDGGNSWQPTTRTEYNYFEKPSGFGTKNVSVRIKSMTGQTITVDNVSCESEAQTTGPSNFY